MIVLVVAVHAASNIIIGESMFSFNVFWIIVILCGT